MIPQTLLFLTFLVLVYCSWYDWKTKKIKLSSLLIVYNIGILYMFLSNINIVNTLSSMLVIGMIFLIPCIYSFGAGDFLLLIGLCLFFPSKQQLDLFLAVFLLVGTIYLIAYYKWFTHSRKQFLKEKFPFIPAIMITFLVFLLKVQPFAISCYFL